MKFEISNIPQLEYLRDYGCKILVLSNSVIDHNGYLVIESFNGEATRISPETLHEILSKPKVKDSYLKIDVVFICLQYGIKIAEVF